MYICVFLQSRVIIILNSIQFLLIFYHVLLRTGKKRRLNKKRLKNNNEVELMDMMNIQNAIKKFFCDVI